MRRSGTLLLTMCGWLAIAACGDGVAGNTDPDPIEPVDPGAGVSHEATIRVMGLGSVADRYTAEIAAREPWAYTTTWGNRNGNPGNVLNVWFTGLQAPQFWTSITVDGATTLGDVQIADDGSVLVVATEHRPNGSLLVYDLSTPGTPRLLARHISPNTRNGVHTVKLGRAHGRLYAFLSINPGVNSGQEPALLVILDLNDPYMPREVFVQAMGNPFIHDVFVRDGWLFTALWNDGIAIFDIGAQNGAPDRPRHVGGVRTKDGSAHNIWWFHDPVTGSRQYAFVGEELMNGFVIGSFSAGDIHVVDVSDMANPREVAFYSVAGAGAHNFTMDERSGVLYAAFYNGGVRALDVRGDLSDCEPSARARDGRCDLGKMGRELSTALVSRPAAGLTARHHIWGVAFTGEHVYASDMLNGIWRLDVSELLR